MSKGSTAFSTTNLLSTCWGQRNQFDIGTAAGLRRAAELTVTWTRATGSRAGSGKRIEHLQGSTMSQRMGRKRIEHASPSESERRIAQRYAAKDVPWITTVKPAVGEAGQLVNISQTGLLFDSRDRLSPGRRTTLMASTADRRVERWPVVVVRTHVVSFNHDGTPLYRTALRFEGAFEWNLTGSRTSEPPAPAAAEPTPAAAEPTPAAAEPAPALCFDGPLDGGLTSSGGSRAVSISNLTEEGCRVRAARQEGVMTGEQVLVALLFSPSYRMTLRGEVESALGEHVFAVRFDRLSADERRLLRVEIRSAAVRRGAGGVPTRDASGSPARVHRLAVEQGGSLITLDGNVW
jgi:hypothetical protein